MNDFRSLVSERRKSDRWGERRRAHRSFRNGSPYQRACVTTVAALLLGTLGGFGQEPLVEARLSSEDPIWVGQKASMIVELKVPGFFSGTPAFDLPEVPGVILMPPQDRPLLGSETIASTSYTVQRHELGVFARSGGQHSIPSFRVRLGYKKSPLDKDKIAASVMTPAVLIDVRIPEGAEQLGNVISARDLEATDFWSNETNVVLVGDALVRTIQFRAEDVPAIAVPPFPAPELDGVSVYRDEPDLVDKNERGVSHAERTDRLTYIFEEVGDFVIPGATLTWFDLESDELKTERLEARVLNVIANPELAATVSMEPTEQVSPDSDSLLGGGFLWLLGILFFVLVTIRLGGGQWIVAGPNRFRPVHLASLKPKQSGTVLKC